MRSTYKKSVTVTLKLNEEEAEWLRRIMQNPLVCEHCLEAQGEDHQSQVMREKLFLAVSPPEETADDEERFF